MARKKQKESLQAKQSGQAALQAAKDNRESVPKIKATKARNGTLKIALDQAGENYIEKTLATTSGPFMNIVLGQLCNGLITNDSNVDAVLNLGLSLVAAIKPRDEIETLLAVQMAAVHSATITFARRLNHVENIPQQDSAERALNKLARTFACQMEALRKHRNGGTQKVIVQHINVEDGAQAVIGHVEQTTGRGEG